MRLSGRIATFLAPEAEVEPWIRYRRGADALRSFLGFALLISPLAGVVFALGNLTAPLWLLPPAVGLPAFACAFLLPRRRRRLAGVSLGWVYVALALTAGVLVVLYLIAKAQCGPNAYECPF